MQFDVFKNTNASTKSRFPYLLDVQADLLNSLETRVVIPLSVESEAKDMVLSQLTPILTVKGKKHVAITPQMAGIPARELAVQIENLSQFRAEIVAALDLLLTGV